MAFLLETKLAYVNDRLVKQVSWSDSYVFEFIPSVGLSDGILVIWSVCQRPIVVYALCTCLERPELWLRLLVVIGSTRVPCCLGGDFNEVTRSSEQRGCVGDRGGLFEFVEFINDGGFMDLLTLGKVFNWNCSRSKWSRLDHFLVSTEWLDQFEGLE
ncbi:hypothetical protein V6N12_067618 [Hibiscus sabdariffa]|uniref:Endonuclease/exonuclease/phosphatase domain-containing protein n=1 Tax=Hibiscus sabdariffa TaxID=183260 RepID=A0ABR2AVJ3_9ROSI